MHTSERMRSPYAAASERPGHRGATPQWTLTRVSLRGLVVRAYVTDSTRLLFLRPQHKTLHSDVAYSARGAQHFPIRCMPTDIAQIVFHKERLVTNESGMRRCDRLSNHSRVQVSQTEIDPGGITSRIFFLLSH